MLHKKSDDNASAPTPALLAVHKNDSTALHGALYVTYCGIERVEQPGILRIVNEDLTVLHVHLVAHVNRRLPEREDVRYAGGQESHWV